MVLTGLNRDPQFQVHEWLICLQAFKLNLADEVFLMRLVRKEVKVDFDHVRDGQLNCSEGIVGRL